MSNFLKNIHPLLKRGKRVSTETYLNQVSIATTQNLDNSLTFTAQVLVDKYGPTYTPMDTYFRVLVALEAITIDEYSSLLQSGLIEPNVEYVIAETRYAYVERYVSQDLEQTITFEVEPRAVAVRVETYSDSYIENMQSTTTYSFGVNGLEGYDVVADGYGPVKADDPNFAVLNAIDANLRSTEKETLTAKIQSYLHSATTNYLDHWGSWFGAYRGVAETDSSYRARIIETITVERGTVAALHKAIASYLNDPSTTVTIYEPFNNLFRLNQSALNGADHLMGDVYRYGVILVDIPKEYPASLLQMLQDFKPAGVLVIINYNTDLLTIDQFTEAMVTQTLDYTKSYYII